MSDIVLTDKQAAALRAAKSWFRNDTRRQQVFSIAGYAGVGKTTLVRHLVADLGLSGSQVVYGCYTGKAAYVLHRKGTPCRTIHSLIYRVSATIAQARARLAELETRALQHSGAERILLNADIAALRAELKEMRQPRFGLNEESEVRDTRLIVLDEVSMVGDDMADDILSFGKPVLPLGDPGQLPPVKGGGAFFRRAPDVMLTEIHRQAAESAVIRLATMARQGEPISYGRHDEFVWKLASADVTPAQLLRSGQVICGKNATRLALNNSMRQAAGFGGPLPAGPGEKVICLRNDHERGLLNGMFITLDGVEPLDNERFRAVVIDEEGNRIGGGGSVTIDSDGNWVVDGADGKAIVYAGHFLDHESLDPERDERDWRLKRDLVEATFGYAITAHKSQGSQWENIIVVDDKWGRSRADRCRWLYTSITRAESGLVILD